MAKRRLTDSDILRLLAEPIPSDEDEVTDVEDVDELGEDAVDVIDKMMDNEDDMNETVTIEVSDTQEPSYQIDINQNTPRKWRKKKKKHVILSLVLHNYCTMLI